MNCSRLKNSGKQIIPEAFDLHILIADKSKIDQHMQTNQKMSDSSGIFISFCKQKQSYENWYPYIAKIEKVKYIS